METIRQDAFFIGGRFRPATGDRRFTVVNPATEGIVGSAPCGEPADVDAAVAAARDAFDTGPWPRLTIGERAEYLTRFADELAARRKEMGELVLDELGLPRRAAHSEPASMIALLRYHAGLAGQMTMSERRTGLFGACADVTREPVGVVAAIPAWNSPLVLAANKFAPAMLAGCTVVCKPAPETCLDTYPVAEAAHAAGIPDGVLNLLASDGVGGDHLARHPGVDKIAFTGSTATGRAVAAAAASHLARVSLELGGKSAGIVCDDAPLDDVVAAVVAAATLVNGQACIALSRVLVSKRRHDELVDALRAGFEALVVGDPRDSATQVGPLVSRRHRDRVLGYIADAANEGGRVVTGGGPPAHTTQGWYLAPTLVTGVSPTSRIAQEEVFAPVLTVLTYSDLDEAVAIANGTPFGLSGAVFSQDPGQARALADRIRSGTVAINKGAAIDFALPFGGFGSSGYGREYGPEGVQEYLEHKTIFLDPPAG
ncbi:aldehyde dehydrogenase family protein [Frankia sp. Cr2]|uniref:aldehyde dehydrogenase family protein n=1 Tax=Frankia sp. Cr2 TaxID=3073932 RepID=UPI002AD399E7|nr:aldehyde dehydrogenase family protein [Frankia sp. Cr2]